MAGNFVGVNEKPKPKPGAVKPERIWELREDLGENAKRYQAFQDYVALGTGRTINLLFRLYRERRRQYKADPLAAGKSGIVNPPTANDTVLRHWREWFEWEERARALDAFNKRNADIQFLAEREEWKKKERELAESLFKKAQQMLAFPLTEVRDEITEVGPGGQPVKVTRIVRPAGWNLNTVLSVMNTGSMMYRRGADLPQQIMESRIEQEISATAKVQTIADVKISEVYVEMPAEAAPSPSPANEVKMSDGFD